MVCDCGVIKGFEYEVDNKYKENDLLDDIKDYKFYKDNSDWNIREITYEINLHNRVCKKLNEDVIKNNKLRKCTIKIYFDKNF